MNKAIEILKQRKQNNTNRINQISPPPKGRFVMGMLLSMEVKDLEIENASIDICINILKDKLNY